VNDHEEVYGRIAENWHIEDNLTLFQVPK